jgi:hypothetical protein
MEVRRDSSPFFPHGALQQPDRFGLKLHAIECGRAAVAARSSSSAQLAAAAAKISGALSCFGAGIVGQGTHRFQRYAPR